MRNKGEYLRYWTQEGRGGSDLGDVLGWLGPGMAKTSELALLPIFSFKAKDCPLPPCPRISREENKEFYFMMKLEAPGSTKIHTNV